MTAPSPCARPTCGHDLSKHPRLDRCLIDGCDCAFYVMEGDYDDD